MTDVATRARSTADACPGALRPHHAADGDLVRVRIPGGAVSARQLRALVVASGRLGDGRLGLTSRGNLQVRGIAPGDVPDLAVALGHAGLLPSPSHERVRNLLASPLSGRGTGSLDDVDPLLAELDTALCARPHLAALPGRFLFALDDGSGDVATEGADVVAVARGGGRWAVRPAGVGNGLWVDRADVVAAVLAVAEGFLVEQRRPGSEGVWRIAELSGGGTGILDRLVRAGWEPEPPTTPTPTPPPTPMSTERQTSTESQTPTRSGAARPGPEPGLIEQVDGRFAVCALVPLGVLEPDQVAALAAVAELASEPAGGRTTESGAGVATGSGAAQATGSGAGQATGSGAAQAGGPGAGRTAAELDAGAGAGAGGRSHDMAEQDRSDALRITPWRRVVVRDLHLPAALAARELLAATGLQTSPGTPWARLTACAGRPGCAKSLTDVHADARSFAAVAGAQGPAVHWAGCERGCGTPAGADVVRVLATPRGYRVEGATLGPADLAAAGLAPAGHAPASHTGDGPR